MNYTDTFIAASEDGPAVSAVPAKGKRSVAEIQFGMLVDQPYWFTQEDVLFGSSGAVREDPSKGENEALRKEFFSRSQACLRCSPLVKKWGFGIHFDADGKAAAFAKESAEYARLAADDSLFQTKGMRTKRA